MKSFKDTKWKIKRNEKKKKKKTKNKTNKQKTNNIMKKLKQQFF